MQKQVEFVPAVKKFFTTWTVEGRASRSEYWWPVLAVFVGSMIPVVGFIVQLAAIIPSVMTGVRRLHDTGKSGWFMLLVFVPLANLVLIYFFAQKSQETENQYGPVPNVAE